MELMILLRLALLLGWEENAGFQKHATDRWIVANDRRARAPAGEPDNAIAKISEGLHTVG